MIESVEDITYDGERLSDVVSNSGGEYMVVNYVGGRSLPNIEFTTKKISVGREHISTFGSGPRELYADITVKGNSFTNLRQLINILSSSLYRERDVGITFDDEPNRTYFGRYSRHDENLESSMIAKIRIYFYCTDGKSYADPTTHNVTQHPTVINEGTAETYPIFDIKVRDYLTNIEIANQSIRNSQGNFPMIVIGRAARVDQTPIERETLIFHDSMRSPNSWQTASTVDNGRIAGDMGSDEQGFYPERYGDAIKPYNWQGPSLIRGIGQSVQDFRADIKIKAFNYGKETGMMDVYLRDANGNVIGKIGFGDAWVNKLENYGHAQVGDYATGHKMQAYAKGGHGWNNFDGIMRIERTGRVWRFYFAQIDKNGNHTWIYSNQPNATYTDVGGRYSAPIHSVQVAFRLWPLSSASAMRIKEIKIYRINQNAGVASGTPFLLPIGSDITIDTKTWQVRLNGEIRSDLLSLDAEMFPLVKGHNRIVTTQGVDVRARYRNAYL